MHKAFILSLGGAGAVARHCGVTTAVVVNWRNRPYGISRAYRPKVAALAKAMKVALPDGFLEPPSRDVIVPAARRGIANIDQSRSGRVAS